MGPGEFIFNQIIVPGAVNLASNAMHNALTDKSEPVIINQVEIVYEGSGNKTSLRIRASGNVKSTKMIGQGPVVAAEIEFSNSKVRVGVGKGGSATEIGTIIPPQPLPGNIIEPRDWRQELPWIERTSRNVPSIPGYNYGNELGLLPRDKSVPRQKSKTCSKKLEKSLGEQKPTITSKVPLRFNYSDTTPITAPQIDSLIRFKKPVDVPFMPQSPFVEDKEQRVKLELPTLDKDSKPLLEKLDRALKGVQDGDKAIVILEALKRKVSKLQHSQRLSLVDHLGYRNPHLPWWVWPRVLVIWGEYCSSR